MSLQYRSTRSDTQLGSFTDILLEGLAPDGGLAMPQAIPQISAQELVDWSGLSYAQLAARVMHRFADDLPFEVVERLAAAAYTEQTFHSKAIAPLTPLGVEQGAPLALLELSNGPTLAFKDMAMQMLGQLFEYVLTSRGQTLNILGATSGDTGSAAEYAMRGKKAVNVFMLSPQGRMSDFQRAQMYSLQDPNIHNWSVPGSFDDCQDMVKAVSADLAFKSKYRIGTVNSINWARITAQVVYYFAGYFQAVRQYGLKMGDAVAVSVPSGNFGNVLSGYVAKRMGLPLSRLVVATNENNVLAEFFNSLVYRPRGSTETYVTSSPSMDISKASNFERYVFEMLNGDAAALADLWRQLASTGQFSLADNQTVRDRMAASGLVAGESSHAQRLAAIADIDAKYNRVIDPHTADGINVGRQYLRSGEPMLVLETALPAKFGQTIEEALGRPAPRRAGLEQLESLPQRVVAVTQDVEALKARIAEQALL